MSRGPPKRPGLTAGGASAPSPEGSSLNFPCHEHPSRWSLPQTPRTPEENDRDRFSPRMCSDRL